MSGQIAVYPIFEQLSGLTQRALDDLAREIRPALGSALTARGCLKTVMIAVDEMDGGAAQLDGRFLARNGKKGHGILSVLLQGVSDFTCTLACGLVVSGTDSFLSRSELITSDLGKNEGKVFRVCDEGSFPLAKKDDVV